MTVVDEAVGGHGGSDPRFDDPHRFDVTLAVTDPRLNPITGSKRCSGFCPPSVDAYMP